VRKVTICVRVGSPEQIAAREWLKRWTWTLRSASSNEGCGCCVDIYFVEALPDALAHLPPAAVVPDSWWKISDLEAKYCQCLVPHLSDAERSLFEDTLTAHDQLWDGELSAAEILTRYSSTADSLRATPHFAVFETAVAELVGLLQSGLPPAETWDRARGCTYDLRRYVARQLRHADRKVDPA
jgi:hypothetical protein